MVVGPPEWLTWTGFKEPSAANFERGIARPVFNHVLAAAGIASRMSVEEWSVLIPVFTGTNMSTTEHEVQRRGRRCERLGSNSRATRPHNQLSLGGLS